MLLGGRPCTADTPARHPLCTVPPARQTYTPCTGGVEAGGWRTRPRTIAPSSGAATSPCGCHRRRLPPGRPRASARGGQRKYSDLAIETARTLRLLFHFPLRHTEGFQPSLFGMMGLGLSAPDHTTLSRRGTRGWKTLHVGVDRSGMIVAQALTDAQADDARPAAAWLTPWKAPSPASRETRPTTRSRSTMPRGPGVRTWWFHRPGRPTCLDTDRDRASVIVRSWRLRKSNGAGGRKRRTIISRALSS